MVRTSVDDRDMEVTGFYCRFRHFRFRCQIALTIAISSYPTHHSESASVASISLVDKLSGILDPAKGPAHTYNYFVWQFSFPRFI